MRFICFLRFVLLHIFNSIFASILAALLSLLLLLLFALLLLLLFGFYCCGAYLRLKLCF